MAVFSIFTGALAGMALTVVPAAVQTTVPDGADGPAIAAADIVTGILAYSRWPDDDGPVRLCVAGQSRLTTHLVDRRLVSGRMMVVRHRALPSLPGTDCDAIFITEHPIGDLRRLAVATDGTAVVTMTDADPDCTSGIMACLRQTPEGLRFDLNLDAVSRSSVRIDPRVLILSGRRGRSS